MTPADLSLTVQDAVRRAVGEGALRALTRVPERVKVERPRPGGSGDWATNAALQLAREAGMEPLGVARVLKPRIAEADGIARVEITGPGFLNITLAGRSRRALVRDVLDARERYGHGTALEGRAFRLSHPGDVRATVWADAVRGLLAAQGADVHDGAAETLTLRPVPVTYDVLALGPDAARWALLRPAAHDRALGPDGLLTQSEANGLFTVRYAHSRARALLRNAAQLGMSPAYDDEAPLDAQTAYKDEARPGVTPPHQNDAPASRLLTALGDHPAVLEAAARHRAPDRVARHLEVTADALLGFQHTVLPLGDEKPSAAHRSRLALAEAAGTVLAGGLALLGISAPDYL
ncbi:ArgS-related anticodon-binding protein NrtL [Streptomyces ficellus]|uniref:arginine--tRNA ligase n=1 Tax=Streptomyces ficellus TaxID=1977088 RepID=A0A6I6FIM7_9ACTN|nr:DALR anticodon-binding domain-containing protein [Streptomyces ficellus]QGV78519.1 arginine--tRNA ligase [Streptomyces ficellus]